MKTRYVLLAALALALAGTACQPAAQAPAGLSDEDVAAIGESIGSFRDAVLAGDWAGASQLFAAEAVWMPPNAPLIEGPDAIRAAFEADAATYTAFTNTPTEIVGSGDVAYARGTYTLTVAGMAEPISDSGKYLAIFRKQADGSWLAALDIWNSDLPLPE
ncbi:MAG: DUF4440 domain-containing protein [Gemmatimonadota bacterium]|nr:MAG: DUF4440 domain-containing protein [Gemmatimonadota bacterium]